MASAIGVPVQSCTKLSEVEQPVPVFRIRTTKRSHGRERQVPVIRGKLILEQTSRGKIRNPRKVNCQLSTQNQLRPQG